MQKSLNKKLYIRSQENHFSKGLDVKLFCLQLFFGQSNITSAYHLPMSCLITANILYKVHVTEDIQIALDCLFRNGKQRGKIWDIYLWSMQISHKR